MLTERLVCSTDRVNIYKQLYSTAMSSPVSVVVAGIVMQNTEEQALATMCNIPLWLRYVDDTFPAIHKN